VKGSGARILLVDDDREWAGLVADVLVDEGYSVETVPDGLAALEKLPSFHPFLVVTDMQMPRMDGRQLLKRLCDYDERLLVIILSADRHPDAGPLEGAFRVIEKPNAGRDLVAAIAAAADHRVGRLPLQRLWRAAGHVHRGFRRPRAGGKARWGVGLLVAFISGVVLVNRLRARPA
jgi:CheY-like chemotaxis protein